MSTLVLNSYAKINCGLNVLGKRTDGYHNIESIFITIDLADTITIEQSDTLQIECSPSVTANVSDNLVYKAAKALQTATNSDSMGAKIIVTKRIPTGAGLGGGSSNAATVLRGLQHLWNTKADLNKIALSLGSDVPFFLKGGICYVTGRGEHVTRLASDVIPNEVRNWVVVCDFPPIHVSTANAYSTLGITSEIPPQGLNRLFMQAIENKDLFEEQFKNRFEVSVFAQHPELLSIRQRLYEQGAFYASLTGSGAVVYGLFTQLPGEMKSGEVKPGDTRFGDMLGRGVRTYICAPVLEPLTII